MTIHELISKYKDEVSELDEQLCRGGDPNNIDRWSEARGVYLDVINDLVQVLRKGGIHVYDVADVVFDMSWDMDGHVWRVWVTPRSYWESDGNWMDKTIRVIGLDTPEIGSLFSDSNTVVGKWNGDVCFDDPYFIDRLSVIENHLSNHGASRVFDNRNTLWMDMGDTRYGFTFFGGDVRRAPNTQSYKLLKTT